MILSNVLVLTLPFIRLSKMEGKIQTRRLLLLMMYLEAVQSYAEV